jgi:anaerobic selenocysteine-containing dehydrogenase
MHSSLCPLDCPDNCSLSVGVENGRVVSVDGDHRNPITAGYICAKVHRLPEALYGEHRVLRPLLRTGVKGAGEFEPVSWEKAQSLLVDRIRETQETHGGEAILPLCYGGSNGFLSHNAADARLFRRLGASRLARTVCASATSAALDGLYGKMPGVAFPDYESARLIVVWGANPHATGIHILPFIYRAQKAGAKLVVVDPRRTKLAARADLHLAPRPGTDLPLALAVHRLLFENGWSDEDFLREHCVGANRLRERAELWDPTLAAAECGLPEASIREFARLYAQSSPAVIRCGWGPERNRNGGSAVAAVLALPAVAGKFGVRGGGYTMSNAAAWKLDAEAAVAEPEVTTRIVNMNRVGRVLCGEEGPPVHLLFVYNNNPAATLPHQNKVLEGLAREDLFTVVFDSFFTDSARWADLVLPAASFLERRELARGYGSYSIQDTEAVVAPVGESRSNHRVFIELLRALDLEKATDPLGEEELVDAWLGRLPILRESLREDGIGAPEFGDRPVQFVDIHPLTPDGKVHLHSAAMEEEAPQGLYRYQPDPATPDAPLALISPARGELISSTLGQLHPKGWPARMHPEDARARGLANGERVRIFNERGEVRCRLALGEDLRPGVVELAKGLWSHHTENGATANALAPDSLTDLGAGACFNDARVQVERSA